MTISGSRIHRNLRYCSKKMRSNSVCQRSMSPLKNPEARVTVSQRSRFVTPQAIRMISDRTEGALTRRTRHRGIKTAKKLIKGPVWEQCRSLPRIYPSLWRTSTGTVQMPAGLAPTDSPALNFLSSALATAAVLSLGDAKADLHRQFDDLGAGGGGQGGATVPLAPHLRDCPRLRNPSKLRTFAAFSSGLRMV